jgi:hypothetical protein
MLRSLRVNPSRSPNARSIHELTNADVLDELRYDEATLIGRISEAMGNLRGDHVYVVLVHIPGKGYSVVVLDDEGPEYFEGYAGIPDAATAEKAARFIHAVGNNHAADQKLGMKLRKYLAHE